LRLLSSDDNVSLHEGEKTSPYDYESAEQLLEDFWREAERIMGEK
jgi:hypothetical protein